VHFGPSPWLSGFSAKLSKCFQFNVKKSHISKISCNRQRHHTIHLFCLCIWVSLFYSHHNHETLVTIIPSTMGICQCDSLGGRGGGGALFALIYFRALCYIVSHFPLYLFPIYCRWHLNHSPSLRLYHLHVSISKLNSVGQVFLSNLKNV